MTDEMVRQTRFTSFDGTLSLSTKHQRPDRFSHLESPGNTVHRIPRGGGYSYSASSFGEDSLVQEMTRFNRFLAFNPEQLTLKVEAGVSLIDLMQWALPRNLHFPVLPGYPLITVGGCIAADVHGKCPYKDGTFTDWVTQLTVYHPQKGYQPCSRELNPALFAMTCGGYGLTGIVTDITLQLAKLPSPSISMSRQRVQTLEEAQLELALCDADIAYSWHDATAGGGFGKGIVYSGHWVDSTEQHKPMKFRPMTAKTRARLPLSLWNGLSARLVNSAVLLQSRLTNDVSVTSILDASFPFASNVYFHKLFGRAGLRESQFLVSEDKVGECLRSLKELICAMNAPTMMMSLKRFRGTQKSLSMSGTGYLIAIDCYRNAITDLFFEELDQLIMGVEGQINLSKDSRAPGAVAQATVSHIDDFKSSLFEYDPERIMRSELSARLGLL